MYFITICCFDKECRFGSIVKTINNELEPTGVQMVLNDFGQIAHDEWMKLPYRYSNLELDILQIMPNHLHGILILHDNFVGAPLAGALGTEYFNSDHLNNLDSFNDQKLENKIYHDRAGVNPAPTIDPKILRCRIKYKAFSFGSR